MALPPRKKGESEQAYFNRAKAYQAAVKAGKIKPTKPTASQQAASRRQSLTGNVSGLSQLNDALTRKKKKKSH